MKRRDLIRYLSQQGCRLVREGGEHSIWENPANNRRTSHPNLGIISAESGLAFRSSRFYRIGQ